MRETFVTAMAVVVLLFIVATGVPRGALSLHFRATTTTTTLPFGPGTTALVLR